MQLVSIGIFFLHFSKTYFFRQISRSCLGAAAIRTVFGARVRAFVYLGVSFALRGRTMGEELIFCCWISTSVPVVVVASRAARTG